MTGGKVTEPSVSVYYQRLIYMLHLPLILGTEFRVHLIMEGIGQLFYFMCDFGGSGWTGLDDPRKS